MAGGERGGAGQGVTSGQVHGDVLPGEGFGGIFRFLAFDRGDYYQRFGPGEITTVHRHAWRVTG